MSHSDSTAIFAIRRPHSRLWKYYVIRAFALGPFFIFPLVYNLVRYLTMEYRFDERGVTMKWGRLFRREISLTYGHIQDIHLSSNILERWFGLARLQIQTASGQARAEMVIEGLLEYETIRDFLYTRMRGVGDKPSSHPNGFGSTAGAIWLDPAAVEAIIEALTTVAEEIQSLRTTLAEQEVVPAPPAANEGDDD